MESWVTLNVPSQQGLQILLQAFQEDFTTFAECLDENFGRERTDHFLQLLESYGELALNGGGEQSLNALLSRATIDVRQAVLCLLGRRAADGELTMERDEIGNFILSC